MSLQRAAGAIALVLLACGPPAAAPSATPVPTPRAVPDCDRAQAQYEKVLAAQAAQIEGAARDQAQTRVAQMTGITVQRCREDEWSVEIAACLGGATTDDEQRGCMLQMRADQHRRWYHQMMTGKVPAEAAADAKVGPSCLQIEARFIGLATGEPSHAHRWAARILFERCLVDDWPEPARTCFANEPGKSACDELLPEPARTQLRDHLVDMAESLGVPY